MRRVDVPVLVVGGGPVGLTAALLLAQQGIACRVVDRRDGPHRAPQAHVVNPRTLEIFRQLGLDTARLRRLATPREDGGHVSFVTSLVGDELGRLPYERQDDAVLALTPEPILNLSQHVLEPVLLETVEATPGIDVVWNAEWEALDDAADGVTSRVIEGGEAVDVHSRWVLAADGAGSRIRKRLGIDMVGPDRLQSFVMIHFEANLRPLVRERPAILYWLLDPERVGSFIAHDIERTWVFMHPFDPTTDPAESYDEARCAAIVRRAIGRDDVALAVRTVSPWHMTSQVAARYRAGRVFLVGDSAHRFPPAGGMGMNTGIQDAHNLVWKLPLVDEGRAGAALLDTYETERRPVAEENAAQSFKNALDILEMMKTLGLDREPAAARAHLAGLRTDGGARIREAIAAQQDHFDMLGLQLGFAYDQGAVVPDGTPVPARGVRTFTPTGRPGARVAHAWVERDGARRSSLDLLAGDAFTLVTASDHWAAAARDVASVALRALVVGRDCADPDGAWLRACGLEPDGALLLRPDQHVAWRARTAVSHPADALAGALATLLGPAG